MSGPKLLRASLGTLALEACATILLWISWVSLPAPLHPTLDTSWQAVLVHAHGQGWQFGRDIIFTAGPWGWLNVGSHPGEGLSARLAWEIGGKLLLAIALVALSRKIAGPRRWIFLALVLVQMGWFPDTLYFLILALGTIAVLMDRCAPAWAVCATLLGFAFIAHFKFTFAIVAFAGVGLACGAALLGSDPRRAALVAATFVAGYVLWWLAAGQELSGLPRYLAMSVEVARGYGGAMSVEESAPVFLIGAATGLTAALLLLAFLRQSTDRRRALPVAAFAAIAWFVVWKHGFTRADGHVLGFFSFSLLMFAGSTLDVHGWPRRALPVAGGLLALAGALLFDAGLLASPWTAWRRHTTTLHALLAPHAWRARFDLGLQRNQRAAAIPEVRGRIGNETVDVVNYGQSFALLGAWTYRPRPIFQSYSAYTPALLESNRRTLAGTAAPRYVLILFSSIDHRFPAQDDSTYLRELLRRYEPVLQRPSLALVRRRAAQPSDAAPAPTVLLARTVSLGESFAVPATREHPLWLRARVEPSLLGRVRDALYKPAALFLAVTDTSGVEKRYRIVPEVAATGFLIQPLLERQQDLNLLLAGGGQRWTRSLRFEARSLAQRDLWGPIHVEIAALDDLPLEELDPLEAWRRAGLSNVRLLDVRAPLPAKEIDVAGKLALIVHAPGELVLDARDTAAARLSGVLGLQAESYQGEGATDGAGFLVEAELDDGRRETVWQRNLEPRRRAGDRGPQRFSTALPPRTVRVHLRTETGEKNDERWDWTYWSELQVE